MTEPGADAPSLRLVGEGVSDHEAVKEELV